MENKYGSLYNNYDKIRKILGTCFLDKSYNDDLSVNDFLIANNVISEYCYGKEISQFLQSRDIYRIKEVYNSYLDSLDLNTYAKEEFDDVGLVLVRPECYMIKDKFKTFLRINGYDILHESSIRINFKQYLLLYYDSFILDSTFYDFPSRTFNYIDNDCYLFVVKKTTYNKSVSDCLCKLKGIQGIYRQGTMRGDLGFCFLKQNIENYKFLSDAVIPLDPIGSARMLVRNKIYHDKSHEVSDIPLLYYCGQTVHVPNGNEIKKDLITLCNDNEVEKILRKCR